MKRVYYSVRLVRGRGHLYGSVRWTTETEMVAVLGENSPILADCREFRGMIRSGEGPFMIQSICRVKGGRMLVMLGEIDSDHNSSLGVDPFWLCPTAMA